VPRVSILTPTYNHEAFVGACIESALAQTFSDWEMLIVDDGSTDATRSVIRRYEDERVHLMTQEHKGVWRLGESYAKAMAVAEGSLIAMLDGDDLWPRRKLEIQTRAFASEDVALAYGRAEICDRHGRVYAHHAIPRALRGVREGKDLILSMLKADHYPYSVTVMVRREAIEGAGGFVQPEYLPLVDIPTWMNLLRGRRFAGLPESLGCYRILEESVCRRYSTRIDEGHMRYGEEFLDASWREIGLSDTERRSLAREMASRYSHRRGYRSMMEGRLEEAAGLLWRGVRNGGVRRGWKSVGRLLQLALRALAHKAGG
jgi:glycosyltransferase involved in cell wall biosynthesis